MAFVNDVRMVANFWLRSGNSSSANNFISFLEDTLSRFGDKKVGLVRLDSGFCQKEIMDYPETRKLNYIIAAKFTHPVQRLTDRNDFWLKLDDGTEVCDKTYKSELWEHPGRIVMIRQKIAERPDAAGKMLSLFPEDEVHQNYLYSAYFTSVEYAAADVWRNYRAGGDVEDIIRELKQDFGAYFEKSGDTLKLRIALSKKCRKWFVGLWDYPLDLNKKISNA
jgi:hypothetical protein